MSIFRINKDKDNPYVMVNKQCLNDERLSWKAKGILTYLLSLPDDWQIYENELIKHSTDKRDSTRTAILELIKNGYIERTRLRDELGRLKEYEYSVYEVPIQIGLSNIGLSNIGKTTTTNNHVLPINNPTNINNNEAEKVIPIVKPAIKKVGFDAVIDEYTSNDILKSTIFEFIKMRKANKKVMTDRALTLLLTNLNKLANNDNDKIAILNQSIEKCWTSVFAIQQSYKGKEKIGTFNNFEQRTYDYAELEKKLLGED